jgi:hypothetical protein
VESLVDLVPGSDRHIELDDLLFGLFGIDASFPCQLGSIDNRLIGVGYLHAELHRHSSLRALPTYQPEGAHNGTYGRVKTEPEAAHIAGYGRPK